MAEPSVQVPTREQIANRLIERLRNSGEWPVNEVWQRWQNLFTEYDRDIALFSQPTPTAEPGLTARLAELHRPVNGHRPHCLSNQPGDGACNCDMVAPPSVADMVPGTTFTAELTRYPGRPLRFTRDHGPYVIVEDFNYVYAEVDQSTIRDVQPPKET
ncbi:hypothetical protein DEJ17_06295 [Curtobacterium sp. MCSS17_011]|uniref:hypothetical protein n=1 Tax=Curtobacterium sp. MCSS17_011 TaxID=2175643 RepID=UPI000D888184|nr:hypothetical protein [Curtobacterium sp. MCSS17_011]PYY59975.1 hypothetical protein DEJ17_06295 [Curtobacterium sp. MCSS17_011]